MNPDPMYTSILFMASISMMVATFILLGKKLLDVDRNQTINNLRIKQLGLEHEKKVIDEKLQMRELTFKQISRELHDHIQLPLTLSKLNLHTMDPAREIEMWEKIQSSISMLDDAIHDLRNIYLVLNTDWIKGIGLYKALEKEIEKLRTTRLFEVKSDFLGEHVEIDADKEVFIFRIVQEAINNIVKYSEAKKVNFSFTYFTDHAELSISDDGKGFQYSETDQSKNGTGLLNIRDRAALLNATLKINSASGKGTSISLNIPYDINRSLNHKTLTV